MRIHVMAINDNQELLTLLETLLTNEGYTVTLHTNNVHDLAEVKRVGPDLLILDCGLGQDGPGWQLLQKLKLDRATVQLPILVCSGAIRQVRDLEGWLGAKGVNILLKPFDVDDLCLTVRRMVQGLAKAPGRTRTGRGATAASSSRA